MFCIRATILRIISVPCIRALFIESRLFTREIVHLRLTRNEIFFSNKPFKNEKQFFICQNSELRMTGVSTILGLLVHKTNKAHFLK